MIPRLPVPVMVQFELVTLFSYISRLMIVAEKDQEEKSDLRSTAEDQIEKVHRLEKVKL